MISTHHNGASVSVERNDGKAVYMIGGDIGSRFENVYIEDRGFLHSAILGADYNNDFHQDVEYLLAGSLSWAAGPSLPAKVRGPRATMLSGFDFWAITFTQFVIKYKF